MSNSVGEETFWLHLRSLKLDAGWVRQHKFHPTRQWQFDFAHPERKLAVEVDGLLRTGVGAHQTAKGMRNDCEKLCEAVLLGWRVLRVVPAQVKSGEAIQWVERLLER